MTTVLYSPTDHLAPIDLAELVERAGLQTRIDRKYLVPVDDLEMLLGQVGPDTRVLEIDATRAFAYESVYFDTPDLVAYRLAAHRRRHRFKVRTRSYLDSAECFLEVKTRGDRGRTVKTRMPYAIEHSATIDPGRGFVADVLRTHSVRGAERFELSPVLVTRYLRTTLLLPADSSRVTIDTDLCWQDFTSAPLRLPHRVVVETKTGSSASAMDRLLWAHGHRPVRVSKYATGLAALRPDLPSSRWHRTLRRHVLRDQSTNPTT